MAGFYAARLGIFKEVETEPDPNAQANTQGDPAAQGQQPEAQDPGEAEQQQDTQAQEQPQENPETNENPEQQPQPEEDPTADTIPNDDPSVDGGDPNADTAQPPQDNSSGDQGGTSAVDDIKKKEEEIYADLTPEELDIKHKELKSQFLAMFDMTTELVQRINNISLDPKDISSVEYVSNNLAQLRTMLVDYMQSVYKTKSYTENYINYNRFLATLNGISKILEEINKNED